jgi:hypothetical protein
MSFESIIYGFMIASVAVSLFAGVGILIKKKRARNEEVEPIIIEAEELADVADGALKSIADEVAELAENAEVTIKATSKLDFVPKELADDSTAAAKTIVEKSKEVIDDRARADGPE